MRCHDFVTPTILLSAVHQATETGVECHPAFMNHDAHLTQDKISTSRKGANIGTPTSQYSKNLDRRHSIVGLAGQDNDLTAILPYSLCYLKMIYLPIGEIHVILPLRASFPAQKKSLHVLDREITCTVSKIRYRYRK